MDRTAEREIDPITLCEPEKEVHVYDWTNRRKFVLDAKSLAILIESKLLYQEGGFPVPINPKNPKNNVEFSYKQMVSIYYQLRAHGELYWGLTTLRESNFNKHRWQLYHKSTLTLRAIKNSILLLDTIDGRELLEDFIFSKMDELNYEVTDYILDVYKRAICIVPKHWFIERFKAIAIAHYESEHFGLKKTLSINAACRNLLCRQHDFLRELKELNIIQG